MFPLVMFQLTDTEQLLLLRTAREAVQAYLLRQEMVIPEVPPGVLTEPHGIFVSLHKHGELRGCIGNIHPAESLVRTTTECAIAAAVGDPRFMPLTLGELPDVEFEISVLSLMEPVRDVSKIEVGKHGLLISRNRSRGLLLPQVATTYGWDRERFLDETCRKAGLRAGDWKQGAEIHCFSALVFGEKELRLLPAS